jgi:DNA-directed RNA polymerase subunit RPC12/RpoP
MSIKILGKTLLDRACNAAIEGAETLKKKISAPASDAPAPDSEAEAAAEDADDVLVVDEEICLTSDLKSPTDPGKCPECGEVVAPVAAYGKNVVRRHVLACPNCEAKILKCLAPNCSNFARAGRVWDDKFCPDCGAKLKQNTFKYGPKAALYILMLTPVGTGVQAVSKLPAASLVKKLIGLIGEDAVLEVVGKAASPEVATLVSKVLEKTKKA